MVSTENEWGAGLPPLFYLTNKKINTMNKHDARKIAETITNEQLKEMFDNAKAKISDWTRVSDVNKSMTKGTAWNILARDFDVNADHHILAKTNMIREFGDFLNKQLRQPKPDKQHSNKPPIHQEPWF